MANQPCGANRPCRRERHFRPARSTLHPPRNLQAKLYAWWPTHRTHQTKWSRPSQCQLHGTQSQGLQFHTSWGEAMTAWIPREKSFCHLPLACSSGQSLRKWPSTSNIAASTSINTWIRGGKHNRPSQYHRLNCDRATLSSLHWMPASARAWVQITKVKSVGGLYQPLQVTRSHSRSHQISARAFCGLFCHRKALFLLAPQRRNRV